MKLTTNPFRKKAGASGDGAAAGLPNPMVPQEGEMPFLDHLEELRWRIFKALGAVLVCSVACLFFAEWVIDEILLAPTRTDFFVYEVFRMDAKEIVLQNRTITGQFFAYFGTVLAVGILIAMPMVIYQFWKFIEPGLYDQEKEGLRFAAVFAAVFFALGASFGYLALMPLSLQFFAGFVISGSIINEFDIARYFSMITTTTFGAAILFELPVVVYFLAKIGAITQAWLRLARKYALIVILIIAAFLTPPDPFSQALMAGPMLLLYEGSIWLCGVVERRRAKDLAKLEAEAAKAAAARNAGPRLDQM
ncbi:MAG: twin-arginine translocase subunit TatC [Bacteroidota bacterium]